MEIHVLNGDALAEKFPITGELIICREAMINGPVDGDDENNFWQQRADFILGQYESSTEEYNRLVVHEFERLKKTGANIINLWFEHDLFCQTNLWFSIDFLHRNLPNTTLYLAMPNPDDDPSWLGFGKMSATDLETCYKNRVYVNAGEKQLAVALWNAYRKKDLKTLENLSKNVATCFPKLNEVCNAHLDREVQSGLGRPQQRLKSIIASGVTDFSEIFKQFRMTEGIYGFGDHQVQKLLRKL